MMDKNDFKSPTTGTCYDEFDLEGERLFKLYQSDRSKFGVLKRASELYIKSVNPEAKDIALLLQALYYREMGLNEEDDRKGVVYFHKACILFGKVTGKDSAETKKVRLEYLKRKIQAFGKKQKPPKELFLERAKLLQGLSDIRNYHIEMSLYYMFSMLDTAHYDKKIIDYANLMVEHAKESGHQELFYKAKVLLHQVKSNSESDLKSAVKELGESLNLIQQTKDRYGEQEARAKLAFMKGMITVNKSKRRAALEEAAKRWSDLGDKKQVASVLKMLLPVPVNVSIILQLADRALENQQLINKTIHELMTITPGPYALFHHHAHLIERIKDVKTIIKRLGENRKEITDLSIKENALWPSKITPGKPYPKRLQAVMSKHHELTEQMKLDMESLYVFGNLLLDQWSYMTAYLTGINSPDSFDFHVLYDEMSSKKEKGPLLLLWDKHRKDIFWLYYQLRSYRNMFIEHVRRPWQRGNTMSVYGDDFNLFIPTPPGWLDEEEIQRSLKGIFHLAPKILQNAPDDYWEKKNLRRVLEVTFTHIDDIEEKKDREKVWDVWKVVGGSTPSYDVVGYRLMNFMVNSVSSLIDIISKNPGKINIGKTTALRG
jgi:hypothetical protein